MSLPLLLFTFWKGSPLESSAGTESAGTGGRGGGSVHPGVRERRRAPARSLNDLTVLLAGTSHSTTTPRVPGALGLVFKAVSLPVTKHTLRLRVLGSGFPPFSRQSTVFSLRPACCSVRDSSSRTHTPEHRKRFHLPLMHGHLIDVRCSEPRARAMVRALVRAREGSDVNKCSKVGLKLTSQVSQSQSGCLYQVCDFLCL